MKIPFVNLARQVEGISSHIEKSILEVYRRGDFILGKEVSLFEEEFSKFIGAKYGVGVGSGTDALLLGLKAIGVGKGDEVIVPAMTFIATILPIVDLGGKPILVDVLPGVPLIDPSQIEKAITKKTKAIIPVHIHGFVCDMEKIIQIAKKHNIKILEDACQAHGSFINIKGKWQMAGDLGDMAAFSFYPAKNLGGLGDGGMITTSNRNYYDTIRLLRNYGEREKYHHMKVGYNSRLDTLQAAVLRIKLKRLLKQNEMRRKAANLYDRLLGDLPIDLSTGGIKVRGNYHIYQIQTDYRDELQRYLKSKNIFCGIHYPVAIHMQPALQMLGYKADDFPNALKFAQRTLSLPMFAGIKSGEIKYVSSEIHRFFGNKKK